MAFHFKNDEAVSEGVRRIAVEQLDKALNALKPATRDRDKAIRDKAVLLDFAQQRKTEVIELDPLAKLVSRPSFQPGVPPTLRPPQIPTDKVEFATTEMTNAIVDLRDKPEAKAVLVNYLQQLRTTPNPGSMQARGSGYSGSPGRWSAGGPRRGRSPRAHRA